ncbi:MAG: capsular polysaccharide biosynthesis protein CapF [Cellulosilyticaceae bacterium]
MKKVLITGSNGFIGKNLVAEMKTRQGYELYTYDMDNTLEELETTLTKVDFIIHLAGINRPKDDEEFSKGNKGLTEKIIDILKKHNKKIPILLSSSIQADMDNPYGVSKLGSEVAIKEWGKYTGITNYIYRLPNAFGKWCRPNYNSVVATFCHNIANELPIKVNDPSVVIDLVYIDDIVNEFIKAMEGQANEKGNYCYVEPAHPITLGKIVELIYSFKESRQNLSVPDMSDDITKKLYSTYLSYLPKDQFSYPLTMNVDERGSFTEILRTADRGQFSVNISKPGITKGNHWHHTKNEKFVVVSGEGLIQFRKIGTDEIIEYHVSGEKIEVVDIPTGYTHNITNKGTTDLVTFMWCNECFDINKPDTYFEKVIVDK